MKYRIYAISINDLTFSRLLNYHYFCEKCCYRFCCTEIIIYLHIQN